jgi:hypothetical protein
MEPITYRKRYTPAGVAEMLGFGLSKTKMLIVTRELRSVKVSANAAAHSAPGGRRVHRAWPVKTPHELTQAGQPRAARLGTNGHEGTVDDPATLTGARSSPGAMVKWLGDETARAIFSFPTPTIPPERQCRERPAQRLQFGRVDGAAEDNRRTFRCPSGAVFIAYMRDRPTKRPDEGAPPNAVRCSEWRRHDG